MSALLATLYPDRVEMAADGGVFDQFATVLRSKPKLVVSPSLPVVVSGCGGDEQIEAMAAATIAATASGTVDDAMALLGQVLPNHREIASPIPFEIVIACWSETKGPQLWRLRSFDPELPLPQLTPEWRSTVALGPALSVDEIRAAGYDPNDFRKTALGLMKAMRRKPCKPAFYGEITAGHYVACHVDHAVISAAGVSIERVHTWPDVIGQPINPKPAHGRHRQQGTASA